MCRASLSPLVARDIEVAQNATPDAGAMRRLPRKTDELAAARTGAGEIGFHAVDLQKMSTDAENCASAGGTDGFYAIGPPDGKAVFGPCSTNADLKFTNSGGATWSTFQFGPGNNVTSAPLGIQFQWNLVPVFGPNGEMSYHTWGGIDVRRTLSSRQATPPANENTA